MMTTQPCKLEGCPRPRHGHGYCKLHYNRNKRNGDPNRLRGYNPPGTGPWSDNGAWKADSIGYHGQLVRVRKIRGYARTHPCAGRCGQTAARWAYLRNHPSPKNDKYGHPYSLDPSDYAPLCYRCHKAMLMGDITIRPTT